MHNCTTNKDKTHQEGEHGHAEDPHEEAREPGDHRPVLVPTVRDGGGDAHQRAPRDRHHQTGEAQDVLRSYTVEEKKREYSALKLGAHNIVFGKNKIHVVAARHFLSFFLFFSLCVIAAL
jgi:hypothetical protein